MANITSKPRKNILLVSARSITRHGVQSSLKNIIAQSPSEYSFTWYCPGTEDKAFAEDLRQMGVAVVTGGLNLFQCSQNELYQTVRRDIWRLCHNEKYDIIHINTGILKFQANVLLVAALCAVPKRISHSHSCIPFAASNYIKKLKHYITQMSIALLATRLSACSYKAAESMFGKHLARRAIIFPNATDVKMYTFSPEKRHALRKELGLEDALVLGHVGVMNNAKNHRFLIDIFKHITCRCNRAKLLLVGGGILEEDLRQQIARYSLEDDVIITGYTKNVSEYLCAMDIFVFPSIYEGLGNVCIEAQTSGLPCVVSDRIPPEAQITKDFTFLPLEAGPEFWADHLLTTDPQSDENRAVARETVKGSRYDLGGLAKYIEQLYG